MRNFIIALFSLLLIFQFNNTVFGQEKRHAKKTIAVTTVDGNVYIGKLLKETDKIIRIRTESAGNITIKKKKIKTIDFDYIPGFKSEVKTKNGKAYKDYPSRYFMGTSGYNLKKGEGYYANTMLFYNEFNYGLSNYFSMGAGTIPLFLFNGAPTPVWIKTKVSAPVVKNKFNISGGAMFGTVIGVDADIEGVPTWLYAAGTIGSRDNNITLSVNYIHGGGEWSPALFSLSGKYKITSRTFLMADSYFSYGDFEGGFITLIGGRTMFRGITLDYGGIIPLAGDFDFGLYVFPYLGIKIGFGR